MIMHLPTNGQTRQLNERQQRIVKHVIRYRHSTIDVVYQRYFAGRSFDAAVKAVQGLSHGGWLQKFPLIYPTTYFVPGRRAVRAYGLTKSLTQPLGPQSLPVAHAVLLYATADRNLFRLDTAEIRRQFPWYARDWTTLPHCHRTQQKTARLELIRVDLGTPADHIARKCAADIRLRLKSASFRTELERGTFAITVATPTTEKAAAIQQTLSRHVWPSGLSFQLAVIPPLLSLLPGFAASA